MKKIIPIMLLIVAIVIALPAGWLNTTLMFVNSALGIGCFVIEILEYKKGK